jgi:branched-subunit amino acid transport protein
MVLAVFATVLSASIGIIVIIERGPPLMSGLRRLPYRWDRAISSGTTATIPAIIYQVLVMLPAQHSR